MGLLPSGRRASALRQGACRNAQRLHGVGDGRLAARALVARLAHVHDARHVLLRLDHALGEAGARRGPDGVVGLGALDALAEGPVAGVAGAGELGALEVQLLVPRGRAGHLDVAEVGLEVKGRLIIIIIIMIIVIIIVIITIIAYYYYYYYYYCCCCCYYYYYYY